MLEWVLRWKHVQHPAAWGGTNKIRKIKNLENKIFEWVGGEMLHTQQWAELSFSVQRQF